MNKLKLLEVVALTKDVPEHRLAAGDVGTVVEIVDSGRVLFVEFLEASGDTRALLQLERSAVRPLQPDEVFAAHH